MIETNKKDKILVIFTGGTICTTIQNGTMGVDPKASTALINFYQDSDSVFKSKVDLIPGKSFEILSENMTIEKWNNIIAHLQELIPSFSNYKGIIIAHGTDTLAYSAALLSLLLTGISIPVFLVSSNYSIIRDDDLPNPKANGNANFKAAVECICMGITSGVYATYKNSADQKIYLHKASHLTQCQIYDENFYSADALDITDFNGVDIQAWSKVPHEQTSEMLIKKLKGKELINCILKVEPYVGLNYDAFNYSAFKAILHSTYHSGTACVEKTKDNDSYSHNSILYMIDQCATQETPVDVYFSPSKTEEGYDVYETVPMIMNHIVDGHQATICYGMTNEMLYAKLLIAYSLGMSKEQILDFLQEIKDEYIIK